MKRILVYMLLLGCFACSDEILWDSEEVVRVKSENITDDSVYKLIKSKFYFVEMPYASHLKALTQSEQNGFIYDAMLVFNKNPVSLHFLKNFKGLISVVMDPTLPPDEHAYYDSGSRVSCFKNINQWTILHEFFHNYQHQQLEYPPKEELRGMIEFEAYMAMDIIYAIERKNVSGNSEIQLRGGNEGYHEILVTLAMRGDINLKTFEENFRKWAKIWDHPDAKNMEQSFAPVLIVNILQKYTELKRQGEL